MKIYLHLLNQLMELVHRLFVLLRDMVDRVKQNHLDMFHHLHEDFVVARRRRKKRMKNMEFG